MELKIHSPVGAEMVSFVWPVSETKRNRTDTKHRIGEDVIETIRLVSEDLPHLKSVLENNILNGYDVNDFVSMKNVCERYNKTIDRIVALEKGTSLPARRIKKFPSKAMLKHILQQTYLRAVVDPEKLNNYEPFSPEVYGETSYELVSKIINHVRATENDVFIDLGSGIGQVVLQVAAATACKSCFGIEKADTPSLYATHMSELFQHWMRFYGKTYGTYEILKGDFLADEYRSVIASATIIFVNNFAFGPSVDHKLKQIFSELKDGTRIFSSKRFCAANFRISNRNLSDIGAIMEVSDVQLEGQVSWTDRPVRYFQQVIDRSKLEVYFEQLKLSKNGEGESDSMSDVSKEKGPVDEESGSDDDPDFEVTAPRSRRKRLVEGDVENPEPAPRDPEVARVAEPVEANQEMEPAARGDEPARNNGALLRKRLEARSANEPKIPSIVIRTSKLGRSRIIRTRVVPKEPPRDVSRISRKPKRPRKKKKVLNIPELDLLHEQITKYPETPPSFEEENFESYTSSELIENSTHVNSPVYDKDAWEKYASVQMKNVEVSDHPSDTSIEYEPSPDLKRQQHLALEALLRGYQQQYLDMLRLMQKPSFRADIEAQIELERVRNEALKKSIDYYEQTVQLLIKRGEDLIKKRMTELGISSFTPKDLFRTARELFNEQGRLRNVVQELETENAALESEIISKNTLYIYNTQRLSHEIYGLHLKNNKLLSKISNLETEIDTLENKPQIAVG